ncbi:hypothetical protein OX284_015055, partial [Flavobacterium sp. SUN046]|uniref:beta strand repeat-containing protein n=1 Tax=Flavobacterium sp. SUN046 TaxID=3002440 RepID=UPI002DCC527A|nr:hypothetical protein [Flavobacterium sp. SUN046]
MRNKITFILLTFLFIGNLYSQNLLVNGDFEGGGNGVGFSLNGSGYSLITAPFSGTTSAGNYAFTTNPQPMNTSNFITGGDHTTGTGNMMVIDGNTTGGSQRFWRAGNTGGGVCGLTVGTTYTFSYWVKSVSTTVTNASTQADIGIQFGNTSSFALVSGTTLVGLPASGWQKVVYSFVPSNSCVNIELWNNNTNSVGNDFAVDDFSVTAPPAPLTVTYSSINPTCIGTNNGSIVVYGVGGISPYVSYSISGTTSQTNATGIFTGLAAGTYTVSVTDSNTPAVTATATGIVLISPTNPLVTNSNSAVCIGAAVNLSVSGGSSYTWTASPADASLTAPNSSTPSVTPLVTTTYTVSSPITTTKNLVFNGDFTSGNVGFTTDYTYYNPTNTTHAQKAYGITTNPSTWESPGISSCGDHTSTTGNMMVVDGSIYNSGNDKVWGQNIPVTAGQNYTFSYWIQSIAAQSPASLNVKINGVSIGVGAAPATVVCGNWVQYTYTWNSGTSTLAQIAIYDTVILANGNDFAIDDIAFTTSTTCTYTKSVIITVNPLPVVTVNNAILCSGTPVIPTSIHATIIGGSGTYQYSWTTPNGSNPGNVSTISTSTIGTYTVVVTSLTTGCVSLPASGTVTNTPASSTCPGALPLCPGGGLTYCNTTNVPSTGNQGCLGSNPNPAWFFLQIGSSGALVLNISQTSNSGTALDVDYICYGPFSVPTCTGLGASNTVGCSYSTAAVETCTIGTALAGQYYMIMITNYANQPGTITFNQSNINQPGAAVLTCNTNCPLTIIGDNPICPGTSTTLTASITGAGSYVWTSNVPGFTAGNVQNITVTQPGTYSLSVVKSGCNAIIPATFNLTNFPSPAATVAQDLTVCNTTFNLEQNTATISSGNPDLTVVYFASLNDYNNGIPIGPTTAYAGTNGQTIYTQIQDNNTFCNFAGPSFVLHVVCSPICFVVSNPSPAQTLCVNGNPQNLTVSTDVSGANSISYVYFTSPQSGNTMYTGGTVLGNSTISGGVASYDPPALGGSGSLPNVPGTYYVYAIVSPAPTDASCRPYQEIIITVNPLPTATLSGATAVCVGAANPVVTFTGANATAPYIFTYNINGGTNQTVTSVGNTATITIPTTTAGVFTVNMISVQDSSTAACSQLQPASIVVTVNPLPTATISGTTSVCVGAAAPTVTFTGANATAPYTFTYTINSGANQTVTSVGNTATITIPTSTAGVYNVDLVSVLDSSTTACSQLQTGSAIITVNPLPTATISGTTAVCVSATAPTVTFTGASSTAPYTFTYNLNGGTNQTVTSNASGVATITVPTTTAGVYNINLTNVLDSSTTACSQAQTGTATITVNPLPTATISGTTSVCEATAAPTVTFTGANATAPYTFTYTINSGTNQTVTSVGNTATITIPTSTAGVYTVDLVSVVDSSTTACSQLQTGSAIITINPLPTATISGTTAVCVNAAAPTVTFTGASSTAPYTFTYNVNGGTNQTVTS